MEEETKQIRRDRDFERRMEKKKTKLYQSVDSIDDLVQMICVNDFFLLTRREKKMMISRLMLIGCINNNQFFIITSLNELDQSLFDLFTFISNLIVDKYFRFCFDPLKEKYIRLEDEIYFFSVKKKSIRLIHFLFLLKRNRIMKKKMKKSKQYEVDVGCEEE